MEQARIDALGGEENMAATDEEVGNVRQMLREVQRGVKNLQAEAKISSMRMDGRNKDTEENETWSFHFALGEMFCFMVVAFFQTYQIKQMLNNKLII